MFSAIPNALMAKRCYRTTSTWTLSFQRNARLIWRSGLAVMISLALSRLMFVSPFIHFAKVEPC